MKSIRMRFGVASFWLILLLTALSGAAPADDGTPLDRLLAHIRSASGAPYAVHIVSEAHVLQDERRYDLRFESDGYRSLTRRCRGEICQGEYFDGERMFGVNLNDTALPSSLHANDEERVARAVATCAFTAPEFRASGGSVTELPATSRNGKTYRRVAVRYGDAAFVVLIDPSTWLPYETITPDGRENLELRDYRKVDGVMLPFEILRDGTPIQRFDSRRVTHDPFVAPRGLNPAFAENPAAVPMVHTQRDQSNQPVVPCTLGGIATNCLIDTGNSSLGISLELAEKLGLEASGEYEISGVGRYVTGIVTAGPLVAGGATFPSARYVVLHDLHDYGYDVAIGADVLAHSRVTIDYPRRQVTFANPARGAVPAIPLRFSNFLPIVDMQLGAIDVLLAIDTGDESSINVPYDFYSDHPDLFEERSRTTVAGIGGTAQQVVGQIASARIGPFELTNQRIGTTIAPEPAAGGHVGGGFLSHFTLTLDYERSAYGLAPRPNDGAVHTN